MPATLDAVRIVLEDANANATIAPTSYFSLISYDAGPTTATAIDAAQVLPCGVARCVCVCDLLRACVHGGRKKERKGIAVFDYGNVPSICVL